MHAGILVGADPELMPVCIETNEPRSSVGLIGGSKKAPRPVERGAIQEDNVFAEFNIDPANDSTNFVENLNHVRKQLDAVLKEHGLRTEVLSSHEFDMGYLESFGEQAMEIGCEPDFCCWTMRDNPKPNAQQSLRTLGGHIHIGLPDPEEGQLVACFCDVLLGIPSILLDSDTRRREMYGKAGAFRPKPYGCEYRVLSNFWLRSEATMKWVFQQAQDAAIAMLTENYGLIEQAGGPDEIQRIINEGDTEAARSVVEKLQIQLPEE